MRSDTNPLLPAEMIRFSKLKPLSKNNYIIVMPLCVAFSIKVGLQHRLQLGSELEQAPRNTPTCAEQRLLGGPQQIDWELKLFDKHAMHGKQLQVYKEPLVQKLPLLLCCVMTPTKASYSHSAPWRWRSRIHWGLQLCITELQFVCTYIPSRTYFKYTKGSTSIQSFGKAS